MNNAVLYTADDGVADIRFNRPAVLNALDVATAIGFRDAVDRALGEGVRVIVLSGEGRGFMAGGDLAFLREAEDRGAAAQELIEPVNIALCRLAGASAVTIAALQGPVAGAGMSLALATDLAVAAEDVRFNFSYVKVAGTPDCSGSWNLARLVGLRRATEIALLSETIGAADALRLGLVNRVVPEGQALPEALAMARRLADGPPLAMARTRALLRGALDTPLKDHLDAEAASFADNARTEDFREGLEAFFGKRPPVYSGR
jgi:2-(1,2-epoxy-1,2-dihydrophenyl)acetyl-CoA isomerase